MKRILLPAQIFATALVTSAFWLAVMPALSPAQDGPARGEPPGAGKSGTTRALEAGAKVLQGNAPVSAMDMYLDGFHAMKDLPQLQMESHHYCRQMNEDFAQCALFDGNEASANLHGIEYIISGKLFETLPPEERRYWHPHNGEILSGQLVAPGIPAAAEHALMKGKINSYGKTWHVWHTGLHGQPASPLPVGEPMLAWSFSRDGEAIPAMVQQRDQRLGVDTHAKRREREDLTSLARPQQGVDDLKGKLERPTQEIPGVVQAR